ncbi:glycosyltransferase family 2 protein [Tersicoccus sp. MR15.9]|uniref:glycosyltransferase family 2 protein n=1 Tax=Tersicoccus mangrovi TaxID=3121635 RepID=UPI002FE69DDD
MSTRMGGRADVDAPPEVARASVDAPPRMVAIVPCHNEEAAVAKVVADLRAAVPGLDVFVYDNASTDDTVRVAREAGATVRREDRKGKGNVVRRAMADLDADVYLLIDGDDTYDAAAAPELIRTLLDGPYDQVTGVRSQQTESAYRPGHALGNRAFNETVSRIFGWPVNDMLSGYRVFSRRFVKSFPADSRAFEIETELTIHAIATRAPQTEVPVGFRDRPAGSESKLRTYHDGFRIVGMIAKLLHHERPFFFYAVFGLLWLLVALILGIPLVVEFVHTGTVPRMPTAILASSLVVIAVLSLMVGILLDGVRRLRQEVRQMTYLSVAGPRWQANR